MGNALPNINPLAWSMDIGDRLAGSTYVVTGRDGKNYEVKLWPNFKKIKADDLCFLDDGKVLTQSGPIALQELEDIMVDAPDDFELTELFDTKNMTMDRDHFDLTEATRPAFCVGEAKVQGRRLFGW